MASRFQLSLFVPSDLGAAIEAVRRVVDPEQSRLIPAHVTLCREDEFAGESLPEIATRLAESRLDPVTLRFGAPERFHEHGILLPCTAGVSSFTALRQAILTPYPIRAHVPHLTLAHPRNPRVAANQLSSAATLRGGLTITFASIQCIEQLDGAPWVVRRTVVLSGTVR